MQLRFYPILSMAAAAIVLFSVTLDTASSQEQSKPQTDASQQTNNKLRALIIDGQNNHGDWPKITAMTKRYLEDTGRFQVDVQRTRFLWRGEKWLKDYSLDDGKQYETLDKPKSDPEFKPAFDQYDVVISNFGYNAAPWPEETKQAFESFVKNGGGFVSIHAADNSFPKWREYNEMIGLGGWGQRNEKDGPYVYFDDEGKRVVDKSPGGGGGHGPQHEFTIVVRDKDHPITKGIPQQFLHAQDELYERLRGPAINMKVLATAYAAKKFRGSGRHEPMLMTIDYGKGRVFHCTLGHADYSMECVAMITLLQRGSEWAATGNVTIDVPNDFPTADKSSSRAFEQ